jgi:proline-specific peptidase
MVDETGRVDVDGGQVWYRRMGDGDKLPLLVLHGGPGAAAYYLEPFAERAAAGRPVVIYDQLGCGRSDKPDDVSLWTVDRSCRELDQVRVALGLEHCYLLGQSWGGWLAIEYLTRGTSGVEAAVLASTSAGIPQFVAEARRLIDEMSEPARTTLIELGARGAYDDPRYQAAVMAFYRLHLCRMDPWPDCALRSVEELDGNQVYLTMNGPTEFDVIGPLRDWDRTADLHRITCPTLVTVGRYDEITPACSQTIVAGVADARLVVFEHSGHYAHEEEPGRYVAAVSAFLDEIDGRAALAPADTAVAHQEEV